MSGSNDKPRILCVDDEPLVLEGLALTLRRHFELETASGGEQGLEILTRNPTIAVVVSDMRMPGMDGAAFLAKSHQLLPDTVRILLTGQADLNSAISAVNEGQIFRFLTKPCPPAALITGISAGVEQHRLITAERVLLEQTLHGSIKALTDVLALVSPAAFGRATRIKSLVSGLAEKLKLRERWQVEVAAMLSQLGHITLPADTAERLYYGRPTSAAERDLVARLPGLTEGLLGGIPRLEDVREILRTYPKGYRGGGSAPSDPKKVVAQLGAQILHVAVDFDTLETGDAASADLALDTLRARTDQYDPQVLTALAAIRGTQHTITVQEIAKQELLVGMVFAEDVTLENGVLLVARGYEVDERFLERMRNFAAGALQKTVWRVHLPVRSATGSDSP